MNIEEKSKLALRQVASTEHGRHFLWDLISFCGLYEDFAGEPNTVSKKLGKRQVALHLMDSLQSVDEELIFTMMRESKNRTIEQEIENDNASNNTDSEYTRSAVDVYLDSTSDSAHSFEPVI